MSWRSLAPSAPARVHLALAASMWAAVGCGLLVFGVGKAWHQGGTSTHLAVVVAFGLVVGVAKARWVLARTARRIAGRIVERGDGRCLGGFLSPVSWLMVVVMVIGGRLLRTSNVLPVTLVAVVYVAVGAGLLVGSFWLWRAWRSVRHGAPEAAARPTSDLGSHPSQRNR